MALGVWQRSEVTTSFAGKRIYIIGLGARGTGRACAQVLAARGAQCTLADIKPSSALSSELELLADTPVTLELGDQAYATIEQADLVVVSPGVPPEIEPLQRVRAKGIPIWPEIEVAHQLCSAPIVAVTGTKGKTTTTTLIGLLLNGAGRSALVGGNIGSPLIEQVIKAQPEQIVVAEVSSFQLELIERFRPQVAVMLNFSHDHLDRHPSLQAYWHAKLRIFEHQTADDFAVLNFDDPAVRALAPELQATVIPFSTREKVGGGVFIEAGEIALSPRFPVAVSGIRESHAGQLVCPLDRIRLRGEHNRENVLAAVAAVAALGAPLDQVGEVLAGFRGVPNRLEEVAVVNGVAFINDSQATTPVSVAKALASFTEPVLLIAGGLPKVDDYSEVARGAKLHARRVFLIGQAADMIEQQLRTGGFHAINRATTLPEAVEWAYSMSQPGEVVLLSPACASFDMFRNMEHRGEVFREAVRQIAARTVGD